MVANLALLFGYSIASVKESKYILYSSRIFEILQRPSVEADRWIFLELIFNRYFFVLIFFLLLQILYLYYNLTVVRSQAFFLLLWDNLYMKNIFCERLRELRIEKNMGQIELANALSVSKGIISLWENGLREPKLSNLIVLAQYFQVSIDYLVGLEN